MPPKQVQMVNVVKDEDHFLKIIEPENTKLIIFDVHPDWCGPCEMMYPTYKNLQSNIDDFEKRVDIFTLSYNKIQTYRTDKFTREASSKPRFVFFYEGKQIDEVIGADIPAIMEKVQKYIPMVY